MTTAGRGKRRASFQGMCEDFPQAPVMVSVSGTKARLCCGSKLTSTTEVRFLLAFLTPAPGLRAGVSGQPSRWHHSGHSDPVTPRPVTAAELTHTHVWVVRPSWQPQAGKRGGVTGTRGEPPCPPRAEPEFQTHGGQSREGGCSWLKTGVSGVSTPGKDAGGDGRGGREALGADLADMIDRAAHEVQRVEVRHAGHTGLCMGSGVGGLGRARELWQRAARWGGELGLGHMESGTSGDVWGHGGWLYGSRQQKKDARRDRQVLKSECE